MSNSNLFKVYRSSAGSGKTYTLVKEYLQLVLRNPLRFRQILAITFTNKAAAEMKDRIVSQLFVLSKGNFSENQLAKDLRKELNLSEEVLQKNAQLVFQHILHHYSDFAVSTIDSFTRRIVNTFAFDLKVPVNFDVELDNKELISKAIETLIERVGTDSELTKILLQFAESNLEQEKNWRVEKELYQLSANILAKEDTNAYLNVMKRFSLEDFSAKALGMQKEIVACEKKLQSIGKQAWQTIVDASVEITDFYQGEKGIGKYFWRIAQGEKDKVAFNSYVERAALGEDCWVSKKSSLEAQEKIEQIKGQLFNYLQQIERFLETDYKRYISLQQMLKTIYSVALLNEIQQIVNDYSMENGLLHISEFNKRIAQVIENEPVPFLYERIGEQYRHYLIDEFQDTSVLQWKNLLPLVENGLSKGDFSMVVGDGKQAIYRFRQGEVEQFMELPNVYQRGNKSFEIDRERTLQHNFSEDVLAYNYRSCKEIVEFNNTFFEENALFLNEKYQPIYLGKSEKSSLKQTPIKEGGFVRIEFLALNKKDVYVDDTCQHILQAIESAINNGYSFSDIVILARSNPELEAIAEFLSQQSIKGEAIRLVSSQSFGLWNSAKIRFLYTLFRFLDNPKDETCQIAILQFLQSQHHILQSHVEDYFASPNGKHPVEFFKFLSQHGFYLPQSSLTSGSIYDLGEILIRTFKLNEQADIYLSAFLNYLTQWMSYPQQSLALFLEDFSKDIKKLSAKMPSELDAIQLLTIHKSKGLEFPVVIYPFADSSINTKNTNLWVHLNEDLNGLPVSLLSFGRKEDMQKSYFKDVFEEEQQKSLLDELNVLYVALTRAAEQLYVFTQKPSEKSEVVSFSFLFQDFLKKKGLWQNDQDIYTFGELTPANNSKKAIHKSEIVINNFLSQDWTSKVIINSSLLEADISPETQEKIYYGVLFHEALSGIFSKKDVSVKITNMVAEGLLSSAEAPEMENKILQFLEHESIQPFFEENLKIKNEAEIITANGKSFRPDRIIFKDTETIIIDFKTGKPLPKHTQQIDNYYKLLQQMNYPNVKGLLIYIGDNEIQLVG